MKLACPVEPERLFDDSLALDLDVDQFADARVPQKSQASLFQHRHRVRFGPLSVLSGYSRRSRAPIEVFAGNQISRTTEIK